MKKAVLGRPYPFKKEWRSLIICCKDRPYFWTIQLFWDFFAEITWNRSLSRIFFVFLHRPTKVCWLMGNGWWHIGKRHWCFVFDRLNYHNQIPIKDKCGGECYGCSIYSRSVPRANYALTHTFRGVRYTYRRGYSDSVRSIGKAVVGRNGEQQMRVPRFLYATCIKWKPSWHQGISQGLIATDWYEVWWRDHKSVYERC